MGIKGIIVGIAIVGAVASSVAAANSNYSANTNAAQQSQSWNGTINTGTGAS